MIVLDYKDRRPLYEQVVERFKDLIIKGILPEDMQMPSVRTQAMQLSINPNTIQRAYSELERQGFIYSVKGKGSFVANIGSFLDGKKEQWRQGMNSMILEGYAIGISRKEMEEMVAGGERQHVAGQKNELNSGQSKGQQREEAMEGQQQSKEQDEGGTDRHD